VLILLHNRGGLQVGSDRGVIYLLSNRCSFHDELVERVWTPFFFSLVLNLHRSSKMWIEPLLLGWCIDSISMISAIAMASGSKEGESRISSPPFGSSCLNSCMLVPN